MVINGLALRRVRTTVEKIRDPIAIGIVCGATLLVALPVVTLSAMIA